MTAAQCLEKLIKFYSPYFKPSAEYRMKFLESIGKFHVDIIQSSFDHITDNDAKPPALASVRAYCYHFSEEAEIVRHNQQMANDRKAADQIFKKDGYGSEYSKACFLNIKLALSGKVTINEWLENCKLLKLNITSFLQYCEEWDVDKNNILGARFMHDFSNTKGYRVRKSAFKDLEEITK